MDVRKANLIRGEYTSASDSVDRHVLRHTSRQDWLSVYRL